MRNKFHVGAVGKRIAIANIPRDPELSPTEALELAAYLVATAIPLQPGDAADALQRFHGMLADAAEDDAVAEAARAAEGG